MTARAARQGWRYRTNVAARALAAIGGGYGVAALVAVAGARLLPLSRLDAVMAATLLSLTIVPAVAIWAFLARSAVRAWVGILIAAGLLALVASFPAAVV